MRQRLTSIFSLATPSQIREGLSWYTYAHRIARSLSGIYGYTTEQIAATISCLSPMKPWDRNVTDAITLLSRVRDGNKSNRGLMFHKQINKARIILEFCEHVTGKDMYPHIAKPNAQKTRSFYHNVAYPDTSQEVTIDSWICKAVGVDYAHLKNKGVYNQIKEVIQSLAVDHSMLPSQFQAICWLVVRGKS